MKRFSQILRSLALTFLYMAAATVVGGCFRTWGIQENIVMVYLLAVLLTSRSTRGYSYGILASLLAFLLYNWYFTEPYHSLKINDPSNIITVIIMSITAIITSALTSKVIKAAEEAREREAESNALYQMTNHLTDAENPDHIASIIVETVSRIFACRAACILYDASGSPELIFLQQCEGGRQVRRELGNPTEFKKRMETLHTSHDVGREFWDYPVYGRNMLLAVVRLPSACAENLTDAQNRLLHSLIENASLALDRIHSLEAQARSRDEAVQERYRGNLLRAISHDLRTPLSGIMGTSEMLMGMTKQEDPRYQMASDIHADADWLHSLVENILNLTKFQDGHLALKKELEAAEEVIGAAITIMEKRAPERDISVKIPDQLILVPMDARLTTQVLVNLLDNAVRHTPADQEICVSLTATEKEAVFSVADRGCGIPEESMQKIFQMFYTTANTETTGKRGIGLGLSICQSIIEAHGGRIQAENRPGGGALFTFTLPMEEKSHE